MQSLSLLNQIKRKIEHRQNVVKTSSFNIYFEMLAQFRKLASPVQEILERVSATKRKLKAGNLDQKDVVRNVFELVDLYLLLGVHYNGEDQNSSSGSIRMEKVIELCVKVHFNYRKDLQKDDARFKRQRLSIKELEVRAWLFLKFSNQGISPSLSQPILQSQLQGFESSLRDQFFSRMMLDVEESYLGEDAGRNCGQFIQHLQTMSSLLVFLLVFMGSQQEISKQCTRAVDYLALNVQVDFRDQEDNNQNKRQLLLIFFKKMGLSGEDRTLVLRFVVLVCLLLFHSTYKEETFQNQLAVLLERLEFLEGFSEAKKLAEGVFDTVELLKTDKQKPQPIKSFKGLKQSLVSSKYFSKVMDRVKQKQMQRQQASIPIQNVFINSNVNKLLGRKGGSFEDRFHLYTRRRERRGRGLDFRVDGGEGVGGHSLTLTKSIDNPNVFASRGRNRMLHPYRGGMMRHSVEIPNTDLKESKNSDQSINPYLLKPKQLLPPHNNTNTTSKGPSTRFIGSLLHKKTPNQRKKTPVRIVSRRGSRKGKQEDASLEKGDELMFQSQVNSHQISGPQKSRFMSFGGRMRSTTPNFISNNDRPDGQSSPQKILEEPQTQKKTDTKDPQVLRKYVRLMKYEDPQTEILYSKQNDYLKMSKNKDDWLDIRYGEERGNDLGLNKKRHKVKIVDIAKTVKESYNGLNRRPVDRTVSKERGKRKKGKRRNRRKKGDKNTNSKPQEKYVNLQRTRAPPEPREDPHRRFRLSFTSGQEQSRLTQSARTIPVRPTVDRLALTPGKFRRATRRLTIVNLMKSGRSHSRFRVEKRDRDKDRGSRGSRGSRGKMDTSSFFKERKVSSKASFFNQSKSRIKSPVERSSRTVANLNTLRDNSILGAIMEPAGKETSFVKEPTFNIEDFKLQKLSSAMDLSASKSKDKQPPQVMKNASEEEAESWDQDYQRLDHLITKLEWCVKSIHRSNLLSFFQKYKKRDYILCKRPRLRTFQDGPTPEPRFGQYGQFGEAPDHVSPYIGDVDKQARSKIKEYIQELAKGTKFLANCSDGRTYRVSVQMGTNAKKNKGLDYHIQIRYQVVELGLWYDLRCRVDFSSSVINNYVIKSEVMLSLKRGVSEMIEYRCSRNPDLRQKLQRLEVDLTSGNIDHMLKQYFNQAVCLDRSIVGLRLVSKSHNYSNLIKFRCYVYDRFFAHTSEQLEKAIALPKLALHIQGCEKLGLVHYINNVHYTRNNWLVLQGQTPLEEVELDNSSSGSDGGLQNKQQQQETNKTSISSRWLSMRAIIKFKLQPTKYSGWKVTEVNQPEYLQHIGSHFYSLVIKQANSFWLGSLSLSCSTRAFSTGDSKVDMIEAFQMTLDLKNVRGHRQVRHVLSLRKLMNMMGWKKEKLFKLIGRKILNFSGGQEEKIVFFIAFEQVISKLNLASF